MTVLNARCTFGKQPPHVLEDVGVAQRIVQGEIDPRMIQRGYARGVEQLEAGKRMLDIAGMISRFAVQPIRHVRGIMCLN